MTNLDEIKATLAMEDLVLTQEEEKLLREYAEGRLSFDDLRSYILSSLNSKAA